jgi:protein-S-isoprenylcysteine O-methyltransferase Ste14
VSTAPSQADRATLMSAARPKRKLWINGAQEVLLEILDEQGRHPMSLLRLIGGIAYVAAFYGLALFLPAGTTHWWRAWALLGLTVVSTTISTIYLSSTSPDVVKERWKPPIQRGQPFADKIILILFILLYTGTIVITPLDVFRWQLLPRPNAIVSSLGLVLYVTSWIIITRVLRENAFASAAVRYQEERHQRVIDTGLYAIVRHPMYAGAIPLVLGLPLWLESYAAALAGLLVCVVMSARITLEEKFLMRKLPGYEDYVRRVRWRLIPGIW